MDGAPNVRVIRRLMSAKAHRYAGFPRGISQEQVLSGVDPRERVIPQARTVADRQQLGSNVERRNGRRSSIRGSQGRASSSPCTRQVGPLCPPSAPIQAAGGRLPSLRVRPIVPHVSWTARAALSPAPHFNICCSGPPRQSDVPRRLLPVSRGSRSTWSRVQVASRRDALINAR